MRSTCHPTIWRAAPDPGAPTFPLRRLTTIRSGTRVAAATASLIPTTAARPISRRGVLWWRGSLSRAGCGARGSLPSSPSRPSQEPSPRHARSAPLREERVACEEDTNRDDHEDYEEGRVPARHEERRQNDEEENPNEQCRRVHDLHPLADELCDDERDTEKRHPGQPWEYISIVPVGKQETQGDPRQQEEPEPGNCEVADEVVETEACPVHFAPMLSRIVACHRTSPRLGSASAPIGQTQQRQPARRRKVELCGLDGGGRPQKPQGAEPHSLDVDEPAAPRVAGHDTDEHRYQHQDHELKHRRSSVARPGRHRACRPWARTIVDAAPDGGKAEQRQLTGSFEPSEVEAVLIGTAPGRSRTVS